MDNSTLPPAADHPVHKDVSPRDSTILGIGFAWELGYTIAIPAVLFGLAGGYADKHLQTSPLFLLLGLALAFVTSFISIAKKVKFILARLPKPLPKKKKHSIEPDIVKEQEALHDLFRPPTE